MKNAFLILLKSTSSTFGVSIRVSEETMAGPYVKKNGRCTVEISVEEAWLHYAAIYSHERMTTYFDGRRSRLRSDTLERYAKGVS